MKTWIYKSLKKQGAYLYLAQKDGFQCLPGALQAALGNLQMIMSLDIQVDTRLALADSSHVLRDLQNQGYYLQYHDPHLNHS